MTQIRYVRAPQETQSSPTYTPTHPWVCTLDLSSEQSTTETTSMENLHENPHGKQNLINIGVKQSVKMHQNVKKVHY